MISQAAADAQEQVIGSAFQGDDAVGVYLQVMQATGRLDEAPEALRGLAGDGTLLHGGRMLVAVVSAYAQLGDEQAAADALAAARVHWSAGTPDMAARLDLSEALLTVADRDDEHAARPLRSLTDSGDDLRQQTLIRAAVIVGFRPRARAAARPVRVRSVMSASMSAAL